MKTHPRRALLIVNPGARSAARAQAKALDAFQQAGVTCDAMVTTSPGHATELARLRGSEYDFVFALGGDGTAMEVVTALTEHGPPVGILPGGTGNVLVRALGIPLSVRRAVPALLSGNEARLDLGRLADGRHFAIGLGVGVDEAMIARASPLLKRRLGFLAYVWTAMHAGFRLEQFDVRLTVDGKVHEKRASSVLIMNLGSVLGGLIQLGNGILHDDGMLHAIAFSPQNHWHSVQLFARMLSGTVDDDPRVLSVSGRSFRLETSPPRRAQADGELLGTTPFDVTVIPQAARLLVPRIGP